MTWVVSPMDLEGMDRSEVWSKGGTRYLKVGKNLEKALKRRPLDNFCICRRGKIGPLAWLSPLQMFHREYAFALSKGEVTVWRLRGPGAVGARLGEVEFRTTPDDLRWNGDALLYEDQEFSPIAHHAEAAEEIAGGEAAGG
jgi:hypothetical protein